MLSISRIVHMCVCLCVCLFTFEVQFKCLFAPTSWSWMSKKFRYQESLGKSNEKKWSQIWTFLLGSGQRKKKLVFCADFAIQNMVETTLPDGLETSGQRVYRYFGISLDIFEFLPFGWSFLFFKKIVFFAILGPPYCGIGATIRIGREILCLQYAGFFNSFWTIYAI